jgi:Coenzyme PQQ synthesis protein D (PqqD)
MENSSMLTKSSIVKVSKEVVHCNVEDEVVILGMKDGVYYGLNPIGSLIWTIIEKPKSVDEILNTILKEYNVNIEESESDLLELLTDLLDKGLIEVLNENYS